MKPLKEGDIIYNRNGTEQEVLYIITKDLYILKDSVSREISIVEIGDTNVGGYKEKEQQPD